MTQANTPTLHCDGDEAECTAWSVDYYEVTAWSVDGTRITSTERSPRWLSNRDGDFCPEHAAARGEADR